MCIRDSCWRVTHRDFDIKGNLHSAYIFKLTSVGGEGQTDDILTYELTTKEDYVVDVGWDETKTRVYTGSGLVKSVSNGRIRFEIYVDAGDNEGPRTIQGYYHPGASRTDFDDRMVIGLSNVIAESGTTNSDCIDELDVLAEESD